MNTDIGARMLVLRKLNGWSQRQLAKRAGVPHSAISMIEHGQVSPSVNSLQKVLDGVPMSLADFFSLDLDMQIKVFYKNDNISSKDQEGLVRTIITTRGGNSAIKMTRECFPLGGDTGEELLMSKGEMVGFVSRGSVEVTVGGEVGVLSDGDGFYFERARPHRFKNVGKTEAEVISAILPGK
ncbi:MAG: helix-turn-helix domain-containing protein [Cellvibrionaceae bacterium]